MLLLLVLLLSRHKGTLEPAIESVTAFAWLLWDAKLLLLLLRRCVHSQPIRKCPGRPCSASQRLWRCCRAGVLEAAIEKGASCVPLLWATGVVLLLLLKSLE